jgi:hypothetical protein
MMVGSTTKPGTFDDAGGEGKESARSDAGSNSTEITTVAIPTGITTMATRSALLIFAGYCPAVARVPRLAAWTLPRSRARRYDWRRISEMVTGPRLGIG